MACFPPGLVWIASYPKSGNTWMRVLLSNLMAGSLEPADINNLMEEETLIGRWRFGDDLLTDVDMLSWRELELLRGLQCEFVAASVSSPFFCKTHDRFVGCAGKPVLGMAARAALYLVRDPRDVAISLGHHLGLSVDETIARMRDVTCHSGSGLQVPYLLGDWGGHVAGWTENALIRTMIVRYEDMHHDTAAVLADIVTFLGGHASEAEISRAVSYSSLGELQRQESTRGFRERLAGQKQFFRSGRVGEWRQTLTASQVKLIEQHFAPVMARFGYERAS